MTLSSQETKIVRWQQIRVLFEISLKLCTAKKRGKVGWFVLGAYTYLLCTLNQGGENSFLVEIRLSY